MSGVLGALGHRINGTPGYGATHEPGISMILRITKADGGWRYRLEPVMREALEAHAPSWLSNSADAKAHRLVAFVRSRFPGWNGFEDPRFNGGRLDEVGYKLATREKAQDVLSEETLSKLLDARDADGFIDQLISVGSDNNLLWQPKAQIGDLSLLHHDDLDRPSFCKAFFDLLYGDGDTPTRLDRYVHWVSSQDLDSMNRWTLPTYFLFFLDTENEIFVKPRATRNFLKLGGWDIQFDAKPAGDDYARIRDAYRELREALAEYGPRHMIDVQSFGWVAHDEEQRQAEARKRNEEEGFECNRDVRTAIEQFEKDESAAFLIAKAKLIEGARKRFGEIFGNGDRLRSLSAETFFGFFNEVSGHGKVFRLGIPLPKNPETAMFKKLQRDLPDLRAGLTQLLHAGGTPAENVDAMWTAGHNVNIFISEGLTVPSALLFIQDPEKWSAVLPMPQKEHKLQTTGHMPPLAEEATLGERFWAFERALTELPRRYGREWGPEVRQAFYYSPAFNRLEDADGQNGDGEESSPPPSPSGLRFEELADLLRREGLQFPREVVANYLLALQTKRFAILTGISGTGKTRIALAVALAFRVTIGGHRTRKPKGWGRPDHAVRFRETSQPDAEGEEILRKIAGGRVWIEKGTTRTQLSVKEVLSTPGLDHDRVLRPQGIHVRPLEKAVYIGYKSPLMREQMADTIFAHNWANGLNQLPSIERGGQHRFGKGRSYTIRVPFHLLGVGETEEQSDQQQIESQPPETSGVEERELENSVVVPVRPDWMDNRGLLGYLNPLTNEYSTTPFLSLLLDAQEEEMRAKREERDAHPFFVVLDEMNLARVEHYFSDFLSALESGEAIPLHDSQKIEAGETKSGTQVPRKLRVPGNVFFTGTVNVDETTYMFSPKVLDRAFTIEFDRVNLEGYTAGEGSEERSGLDLSADDERLRLKPYTKPGRDEWLKFTELAGGRFYKTLAELHGILEREHRHFGYRVANEIARFVNLAREQSADKDNAAAAAFDLALLQKVLPKFHGTQQELEDLLKRLFDFAVHGRDRGRRRSDAVRLDGWSVVDGRLTPSDESGLGGPGASESDTGGSKTADAGPGSDGAVATRGHGRAPAFPRTGAKIWRMLRRLEQRGFTSFIE
ncbi:hypothetical protein [Candidatus Palauibacter sp.]|uniref:hypothetical protein n=1 Tax=Candidatus Palauibacter sp. TaxID=3101350 RepID=UPI003B5A9650